MTEKYLFYILLHALQCSPKRVQDLGEANGIIFLTICVTACTLLGEVANTWSNFV